jgi:hypothetical protein
VFAFETAFVLFEVVILGGHWWLRMSSLEVFFFGNIAVIE